MREIRDRELFSVGIENRVYVVVILASSANVELTLLENKCSEGAEGFDNIQTNFPLNLRNRQTCDKFISV